MKIICLEDQYYSDFVQEKTSQPLVTVNWSKAKSILSIASDVCYAIMGVSVIYLLIVIGGIY